MRKLILALTALLLLLSPEAYSQKKAPVTFPSNEISLSFGCGYNTADKMFDDMDSFYNVTIADEIFSSPDKYELKFEDIDGEDNGGSFETATETFEIRQTKKGDGDWYSGAYEATGTKSLKKSE